MKKTLFISAIMAGVLSIGSASAQTQGGLFGTTEFEASTLEALPQWQQVISTFSDLKAAARSCDDDILKCSSQQMTLWRTKIQELEHAATSLKIREINSFINRWQNASDQDLYGQDDHWAAPLDFIKKGGDSEDFAIMKYVSLKELGINPSQMRIAVTSDVLRGQTHTILAVKFGGKTLVLDSQNDSVLADDLINYYVPFYSANETTRWAHIPGHIAEGSVGGIKQ